jgi:hypothetical protein
MFILGHDITDILLKVALNIINLANISPVMIVEKPTPVAHSLIVKIIMICAQSAWLRLPKGNMLSRISNITLL